MKKILAFIAATMLMTACSEDNSTDAFGNNGSPSIESQSDNWITIEKTIKTESKELLKQSFSIGNQLFEIVSTPKFDATGMNDISTISSNGKTCTNTQRLGFINEKLCKEESAEFLLSARDKSEDELYYKEGPVEGFSIDNNDQFKECTKGLPTEETKQLLSQYVVK